MTGRRMRILDKARRLFRVKNPLVRDVFVEFGSTFMLLFLGTCNVAQFVLTHQKLNSFLQVQLGWGMIIMFCVYTCARTTGAQMNPAVSFTLYTFGDLTLQRLFFYSLAQFAGAAAGAGAMYLFYTTLFDAFDGGHRSVHGDYASGVVFCSFPSEHVTFFGAYIDQIVGTAVLCFMICTIIDERSEVPNYLKPMLIGLGIFTIGTCFAVNLGYPINPARDLGPRIIAFFVYGQEAFTHPHPYYWIAPVLGPMIGGPIGGWIYYLFFGFHQPPKSGDVYRIVESHELKEIP